MTLSSTLTEKKKKIGVRRALAFLTRQEEEEEERKNQKQKKTKKKKNPTESCKLPSFLLTRTSGKLDANGRLVLQRKFIASESRQQIRLAHTRISDQHDSTAEREVSGSKQEMGKARTKKKKKKKKTKKKKKKKTKNKKKIQLYLNKAS
jgi:hypothetical protein